MPDSRPLLRLLGRVLGALALTIALVVALATIVVPKLMGAMPYTVLTGSMSPAMEPGALAIVAPTEAQEIRIGDVVTYQPRPNDPAVVTHRVIGINVSATGTTFTTQGDANTRTDPHPVVPEQIRGTVAYAVPWMGHVNSSLNAGSRSSLMVGAACALILYGLWQVGSGIHSRTPARIREGEQAA
ncbi:signal peptidase I [Bogoriella caseilytica]|uniref:Signal peptidase I n=1 Tax=Bogoriella caseilytica TaxID=56055 RepID=A0A3N2BDM9_9MICO|nr:signal peptidase I [Bogoriella caseilytica]ROR73357.1 signal peptidase [Bogoriella caseilytica]